MQCAAVISRSFPGLDTTLAVQKWLPLASCSNSAPTRGAALGPAVWELADCPGRGTRPCAIPNGCAPSSLAWFQKAGAPARP